MSWVSRWCRLVGLWRRRTYGSVLTSKHCQGWRDEAKREL